MRLPDRSDPACRTVATMTPAGWAWYIGQGRWWLAKHLDLIDAAIVDAVEAGKSLLIEAPPGHGKSEIVRAFIGWYLGRWPDKRLVHVSNTLALSMRAGVNVREDLREFGKEVWGISVSEDVSAAHHFEIEKHRGSFYGVGVGGALTGRRADAIVSDDIITDRQMAYSETQRQTTRDWLFTVLMTRREPGCIHIGIQTRWHEEDPHGLLLKAFPDQYRVLRLPALAEDNDPLGRQRGEALWPERFPVEALEAIRDGANGCGMSSMDWAALYQQRPAPEEGGVWKRDWWKDRRFVVEGDTLVFTGMNVPLASCFKFLTVDTAQSLKTMADFTAIGAWAITPGRTRRLCLLEMDRRRIEAPDVTAAVRAMLSRWKASAAYIEDAGSAVQYAQREGIPVRTVSRKTEADLRLAGDKVLVAMEAAPWAANGGLWVPRTASWFDTWEAEMLAFPGTHDDQADATAWACHVARSAAAWGSSNWTAAPSKPADEGDYTAQDRADDERVAAARYSPLRSFLQGMGPPMR